MAVTLLLKRLCTQLAKCDLNSRATEHKHVHAPAMRGPRQTEYLN